MRNLGLALAALPGLIALPTPVPAQGVPVGIRPGEIVRFRLEPGGWRVSGRIATITRDTLWLEAKPHGGPSGYPRSGVVQLQERIAPSGGSKGVLLGAGLAGGLGVVWGSLLCSRFCEDGGSALVVVPGVILGAIGGLTGGILGAVSSPSKWSTAVWPAENGVAAGFRLETRF